MARPSLRIWSIWILKANLIIWAINALVLGILIPSGSSPASLVFSHYFSIITLLETGVAFFIGGAIAFSGSILPGKVKDYAHKSNERWSVDKLRESERRANRYLVLALILFAESVLISFLGV